MAEGRSYRAGVERALFTLSAGSCYFPDCPTPVVVFVENHPVVNVEIAHIYGHAEGSARYDPTMNNENRRSFDNLVLLCHPHHKLVDRLEPDRFPASVLLEWKHARESYGVDRDAISQLTESKLSDLIEDYVRRFNVPTRLVRVEVFGGTQIGDEDLLTKELGSWRKWVEGPGHAYEQHNLVIYVRNVGQLDVTVNSVRMWVRQVMDDEAVDCFSFEPALLRGARHPRDPAELPGGSAQMWHVSMEGINKLVELGRRVEEKTSGQARLLGFYARVQLQTGMSVDSPLYDVSAIPPALLRRLYGAELDEELGPLGAGQDEQ